MFGRRAAPQKPEEVVLKKQLSEYLIYLADDLDNNPDAWENISLKDYLRSISSYLEDSSAQMRNKKKIRIAEVAELFYVGKIYE